MKSVFYRGGILLRCQDYADWHSTPMRDTRRLDNGFRSGFIEPLPSDPMELEKRYMRYCSCVKSNELTQLNNDAWRRMSEAFPQLPNLSSVTFDPRLEHSGGEISAKSPCGTPRWSLIEPGTAYFPAQFGGLVGALDASGVSLNRFDVTGICWHSFEGSLQPLGRIVQRVNHLSLCFQYTHRASGTHRASWTRRDMLHEVVSKASGLQTLELCFLFPSISLFPWNGSWSYMELSEFLPRHAHWPSLARLKLEKIPTTQSALMDLLSSHARTLRSLQLQCIGIYGVETTDEFGEHAWTEMVHFMQRELSLTEVFIDGNILGCNIGCETVVAEGWWEDTLGFKVERYIIDGGVCPLDNPRADLDDYAFWHAIKDYSWNRWGPSISGRCLIPSAE